jgi:hypothetical protein
MLGWLAECSCSVQWAETLEDRAKQAMNRVRLAVLGGILSLIPFKGSAQDYTIQPVPPNFTRDANTTFLVNLTAVKTQADFALGNGLLTLNTTNFQPGVGFTGPVGFSTARNWPTNVWTIEMLVRVPYQSGIISSNNPIGLLDWQSNPQQYSFDFTLDAGWGVFSRLHSWNTGNGSFLAQPYAGGNGYNVQTSAADKWVYIGVGCDFSNHFFCTAARELTGEILNSNIYFAPFPGSQTNSAASWLAMSGFFSQGMPGTVSLGSNLVQIQAVKISNVYRTNLFTIAPLMSTANATNWLPATIAPARTQTRIVTRNVGYPGYYNYVSQPVVESYLELTNGSAPISLQLTNLSVGLYSVYIWGTIDPQGRTNLPVVWRPCPMSFQAYDASSNLLASGKMLLKQSLVPRRMQGFSFHLDQPTASVTATFAIPANAMEYAQILSVNMFNQLASSPMVAVKTAQTMGFGPTNQYASLPAGWQTNDDAIWFSLPPLNMPIETGAAAAWAIAPTNVDTWITAAFNGQQLYQQPPLTFAPLNMLDTNTSSVFYQSNVATYVAFPGNYPDAGTGIYYSKSNYPAAPSDMYRTKRAELLADRYVMYFASIVNVQGSLYGLQNAQDYFSNGTLKSGHDAALALVRFAFDWPALEMNLQQPRCCTTSADPDYQADWSNPQIRNGKLRYVGWSGTDTLWLFTAYDQVFPYLNGNQLFANEVHRYVPWVNTPQDVIKLLDNFLVFPSVRDVSRGLIDPTVGMADAAGQVLGPGPYSNPFFDLTHQFSVIYPTAGGTYQEMYGVALSRSGTEYIGSFMVYGFGTACDLINKSYRILQAKNTGVPVPMDLSDTNKYPKVLKAGDYLINMWVAGGFPFMIGDASGGPHTSLFSGQANAMAVLGAAATQPSLNQAWSMWHDGRYAWLLKSFWNSNSTDLVAAATGNPVLTNVSRVLPDWGVVVEVTPSETNLLNKTAATIRLGIGQGHAHSDYLDLNLFGFGLPLAVDLACRNEATYWSRPGANWSFLHNHALSHSSVDPNGAGAQTGEPWLKAFAPPLVRASYNDGQATQLDRQMFLMQVGNTNAYYAFDVQWLGGGTYHTWAFHGCESSNLVLNVPMTSQAGLPATNRWIDRTLEGTQYVGPGTNTLQAIWTMTRAAQSFNYSFNGGGTLNTVACEPTVLGTNYNSALPPVRVRATLLGRGNDVVLQGNPYSATYQYCFPFLWCQTSNETASVYPAVYDWYRGTPTVSSAVLLATNPVRVQVTAGAQTDTYECATNCFLVVSRDTNGIRYAQLNGYASVNLPDLTLTPGADYAAVITSIDYTARTLTTSAPLPQDPLVTVGNAGRKVSLQLYGAGTSFNFKDDLSVLEGQVTSLHVTGPNTIALSLDQSLLFDGAGNRCSSNMVVTTEDGLWHFRNNTVIRSPAGAPLTTDVFTDANGDGLIDAKMYEIGEGDTVNLPADVTIQTISNGWRVKSNVPLMGNVNGTPINLGPASGWQNLTKLAPASGLKLVPN